MTTYVEIVPASESLLPPLCRECLWWQRPVWSREAPNGDGARQLWLERLSRDWGSCGTAAVNGRDTLGAVQFAPLRSLPRAQNLLAGLSVAESSDAVMLFCLRLREGGEYEQARCCIAPSPPFMSGGHRKCMRWQGLWARGDRMHAAMFSGWNSFSRMAFVTWGVPVGLMWCAAICADFSPCSLICCGPGARYATLLRPPHRCDDGRRFAASQIEEAAWEPRQGAVGLRPALALALLGILTAAWGLSDFEPAAPLLRTAAATLGDGGLGRHRSSVGCVSGQDHGKAAEQAPRL